MNLMLPMRSGTWLPPPDDSGGGMRFQATHLLLAGGAVLLLVIIVALAIAPRTPAERPVNRGTTARLFGREPVPEGVNSEAVEILRQMEQAAKAVQTLQLEGVYEIASEAGTLSHRRSGAFRLAYREPNFIHQVLETSGGMQTDKIITDGHALFLEISAAQLVLRMRAPTTAAGLAQVTSASLPGTQSPLDLFHLVGQGLNTEALELAAVGIDRHDPWISGQQAPERSIALTVRFAGWPQTTVWVDEETYLLRQIAQEISDQQLHQMAERLGGVASVLFRSLAEPTRVRVFLRQFVIGVNVPLPGNLFDYSLPEGFELIDVADWEQARQVLMERIGEALAAEALAVGQPPTVDPIPVQEPEWDLSN